jgi:Leucine-rich repeat (LRR) protein
MGTIYISGNHIRSLKNFTFSDNIRTTYCYSHVTSFDGFTELNCEDNQIRSLEECPSVIALTCNNNQLTSLKYCPNSISRLQCGNNQLKSLKYCPNYITYLNCPNNQLTSLEYCPSTVCYIVCSNNQLTSLQHCPNNVRYIDCSNNQLTSLQHCPNNVRYIDCSNNPLNNEYNNLTLDEVHKLNRAKAFVKGILIVDRIYRYFMAQRIQKRWRWWWYDDLDSEGISRFAKFAVDNCKWVF